MFAHRRLHRQRLHEEFAVTKCKVFGAILVHLCHHAPEHSMVLGAMGHEQIFVDRVEPYDGLPCDRRSEPGSATADSRTLAQ